MPNQHPRYVVAVTGASGAVYAVRLLQVLLNSECEIHFTISPSGAAVVEQELGIGIDPARPDLHALTSHLPSWATTASWRTDAELAATRVNRIHVHAYNDFMTPIASGSFQTEAMVVCPCSGSSLSAIARSAASNLITRAAEVHLKEHRKLVLVPRETPLSVLQLENMHRLAAAGVVILPAMPGWYQGVQSLESLADFIVSRILDQIGLENTLIHRWGESDA